MSQKKYVSLSKLSTFLDNLYVKFSSIGHKHTLDDITNYAVDSQLSSTSTNPVQNKVIDAEFEAVSAAMNALESAIDGKSDSNHNHDNKYYTETEIDTKLASKSDTTHKHDGVYDTKGAADAVQKNVTAVSDALGIHTGNSDIHVTAAKKTNWDTAYTHSQSTHARTDATKVADSTTNGNILINGTETNVYSHPNSGVTAGTYKSVTVNAQGHVTSGSNPTTLAGYGITDAETKTDASSKLTAAKTYADQAAQAVKNDLLNGAGGAYDTLKELGDLIDDNKDAIDALETVASGKADKVHSHAISDVTNLQSTLDGKAAKSHGTHVTYSTTAPKMNGTAAVGTAENVSRGDHVHPTDTSRASKAEFDAHTVDTVKHITSTERNNWNIAYTHSQSDHSSDWSVTDTTSHAYIKNKPIHEEDFVLEWDGNTAGKPTITFPDAIFCKVSDYILTQYDFVCDDVILGLTAPAYDEYFEEPMFVRDTLEYNGIFIAGYSEAIGVPYANMTLPEDVLGFGPITFPEAGTYFCNNLSAEYYTSMIKLPNTAGKLQTKYMPSGTATKYDIIKSSADASWAVIYDTGEINGPVNSFSGFDISGYKKIKVAIKCVGTNSNPNEAAGSVVFYDSYSYPHAFTSLFGNLIKNTSGVAGAMADFVITDGFIICENALRSTDAQNMLSMSSGAGEWLMTNVGGGVIASDDEIITMSVAAENMSENHFFGAGSRVVIWGCKL